MDLTDHESLREDGILDGQHKIELHRDHGLLPPYEVPEHLKGKVRELRSRPLTSDAEWESMTNCWGLDPDTEYPNFDQWTLKP